MQLPHHESAEELLHKDHYTVSELAELLDVHPYVIWGAVRDGQLRARKIGHDIVSIRRDDVIEWLRSRE